MEELKDFIESLENNEYTKERIIRKLKQIYNNILKENTLEELNNELCLMSKEIIDMYFEYFEIFENEIEIYENNEEFYENNCSGYLDAIQQAIDSYDYDYNDEYIDKEFLTYSEEALEDYLAENSYILANCILDNKEETEEIQKLNKYLTQPIIDKIKIYQKKKIN